MAELSPFDMLRMAGVTPGGGIPNAIPEGGRPPPPMPEPTLQDKIGQFIDAQLAQQEAAKHLSVFQNFLQGMALSHHGGHLLIPLLLAATGTPNPLADRHTGSGTSSIGDLLKLATFPQQQERATVGLEAAKEGLRGTQLANKALEGAAGTGPPGEPGAQPGTPFKVGFTLGRSGVGATLTPQESDAEIQAKAAARARGAASVQAPAVQLNQGVPYAVKDPASGKTFAFDDPTMPPGLQTLMEAAKTAHGKRLSQLTETTKTMISRAPSVIDLAQKNIALVNANQDKLGPFKGRAREFWVGTIGAKDPTFNKLRTDLSLLSSLLLQMHVGSRGGEQMIARFDKKLTAAGPHPDNLKATLQEIISYAQEKIAEGQAAGMSIETPRPGAAPTPGPSGYPLLDKYRRP